MHLFQRLHHMDGGFFPTVPHRSAANVTVLYFGRTCKDGFRAQASVAIHINLCGQRWEGTGLLQLTLPRESSAQSTTTQLCVLIYTSVWTPNSRAGVE